MLTSSRHRRFVAIVVVTNVRAKVVGTGIGGCVVVFIYIGPLERAAFWHDA